MGCFFAICLIFLLGIVSACNSDTIEPLPPKPVEEHVVVYPSKQAPSTEHSSITSAQQEWDLQVTGVNYPGSDLQWSNYGDISKATEQWVVVTVSLANRGNRSLSLNPMNFRVKDANNHIYNHYSNLTIADLYARYQGGSSIVNEIISSHEISNYYLLFDLPRTALPISLEFIPEALKEAKTFSLNQIATSSNSIELDWKISVNEVEEKGKTLIWSPYSDSKEASGRWMIVCVKVQNLAHQDFNLDPFNFKLIDSRKRYFSHYDDLSIAQVYSQYRGGQAIMNDVLSFNEKSSYYLVFDIPTDAVDLKLEFTPDVLKASSKLITLPGISKDENIVSTTSSVNSKN